MAYVEMFSKLYGFCPFRLRGPGEWRGLTGGKREGYRGHRNVGDLNGRSISEQMNRKTKCTLGDMRVEKIAC